ncbi:Hypothetical predicted protein, partial [Olea europaea subsp. europaea]
DKSGEKLGNDDFIIAEINFDSQNTDNQAQFEVEPHQVEPQIIIDDENFENEQHLEPAHDLWDYQLARDRERRQIRPPSKHQYADFASDRSESNLFDIEPASYEEAISSKESHKWITAMEDEMNSFFKNETLTLVEKLKDCKLIDCKWVYKIKEGETKVSDKRDIIDRDDIRLVKIPTKVNLADVGIK